MENPILSPKVRMRATLCHMCGLTFVPISIAIQIFLRKNGGTNTWISGGIEIYGSPTFGMIIATIIVMFFWKLNEKLHPFVDQSGRRVTNFMLSYSLYFVVFSSVILASCGVPLIANTIGIFFLISSLFIAPFGLLMHFCSNILGAVTAWKGKIYKYHFMIKFFRDRPEVS
jgi:uncharacterized Tic20 family protein